MSNDHIVVHIHSAEVLRELMKDKDIQIKIGNRAIVRLLKEIDNGRLSDKSIEPVLENLVANYLKSSWPEVFTRNKDGVLLTGKGKDIIERHANKSIVEQMEPVIGHVIMRFMEATNSFDKLAIKAIEGYMVQSGFKDMAAKLFESVKANMGLTLEKMSNNIQAFHLKSQVDEVLENENEESKESKERKTVNSAIDSSKSADSSNSADSSGGNAGNFLDSGHKLNEEDMSEIERMSNYKYKRDGKAFRESPF